MTKELPPELIQAFLEIRAAEVGQTVEEYLADPELRFQGGRSFFTQLIEKLGEKEFLKDPEQARADVEVVFGRTHDRDGNEITTSTIGFSCRRSHFEKALHEMAKSISSGELEKSEPFDSFEEDIKQTDIKELLHHHGWNGNEPAKIEQE